MNIYTDRSYPPRNNNTLIPAKWTLTEGVNIRRDTDEPTLWRPTGKPQCLTSRPGIPLFCFIPATGDGRQVTFWLDGMSLSYTLTHGGVDIYSAQRHTLGSLPARPLEFIAAAGGVVKLLLDSHEPAYITYTDDLTFTLAGTMPQLPAIGIGVTDVQMLRTQVRGGKLSGESDGRSPGTLAAADNLLLVQRGMEAYKALTAQAAAQGSFLQPVLARWRILDAAGATLMRGPWVYPSAPLGLQCTGAVSLASGDALASVNDGVLQAQTYRLALLGSLPAVPEPWRSVAATMVVEVTPEISPVDEAGAISPAYADVTPAGATSARFYLPGCSPSGAAHQGLYRSKVIDTLRTAHRTARVVQVIDRPFAPGASAAATISSHTAQTDVAPDTPGGTYAWSASLRCGSSLFLANPLKLPPQEIPVGCFAIAPDSYSPLITSYSTSVKSDTSNSNTLKFSTITEAGISWFLTDDLACLTSAPQILTSTSEAAPQEGTVHFIDLDSSPGQPVASRTGAGRIMAMAQPPRGGSSWDFARTKLLIFATDGIRLATFSADGSLRSSAPFDPRGVTSPAAVCAGLTPAGASCIYALAGGDLLRILPSRTETVISRCGAKAIAWCHSFAELWMLYDDHLERLLPTGERIRVLSDEFADSATVRFARFGAQTLLSCAEGLFTPDSETAPALTRCRVRLRATVPGMARHAELEVCGADVTGSVTLSGDNGSEIPELLAAFGLRGPVNAPVCAPLRVPFRRRLTLDADLRLSPASSIRLEARGKRLKVRG